MKRLIPLVLLAACGEPAEAPSPAAPAPPPVGQPAEAPSIVDPASTEAAVLRANDYFGLIDAGWHDRAWERWVDGGEGSGLTQEAFARQFADYARYEASLGAPREPGGAAGSIYLEIPVKVAAVRKDGTAEALMGSIVMKRVNDVPGSTPEQRAWNVFRVDLQPIGRA